MYEPDSLTKPSLLLCPLPRPPAQAAVEDCSSVLELEPKNAKAMFRRGQGLVGAWLH